MVAKATLFEYAIVFHPIATKEMTDKGIKPQAIILKDATRILAQNEKEAGIIAARAVPEEYMDKLDQVDLVVRPF